MGISLRPARRESCPLGAERRRCPPVWASRVSVLGVETAGQRLRPGCTGCSHLHLQHTHTPGLNPTRTDRRRAGYQQ